MSYKKVSLLFLNLFLFGIVNVTAQSFRLNTDKPVAGTQIPFTYDASTSPLKDQPVVNAIVYYFKNYQWNAQDVPIRPDGKNLWKGNISTGKDWAFMTFKFKGGDSTDNNKNMSYGTLLLDGNDSTKNLPGGYAAWGLMRSPGYGFEIPDYLDGSKAISDTVTHMWLTNELTRFSTPAAKQTLALPFAMSIYKSNGGHDDPQIQAAVKFLNTDGATEENLLRVYEILSMIRQTGRADSVADVINKRFPAGSFAKLAAYKAFMNEKDPAQQVAKAASFLKTFPRKNAVIWFDQQKMIEYDRVYLTVVLSGIKADDFTSIDKYLDELPYKAFITIYYKTISISNSRKTINDAFLYPYSVKMIKRMEMFKENQPAELRLLTPREWGKSYDQTFFGGPYLPMLYSHISICRSLGKYDEALKYAALAQAKLQYKREWLNDDYVFLLNKKGMVKEANEAMIKSMYENQASAEIISMIKQNYITENKSEAGFDKYLQSLKNAAATNHNNDEEDKMIKIPMVDWTMKDLNGKTVSFKSLRGKVVVMDFWATWCVPCKASLPGMNLAYQKYKNDPNVVFYFVDTEETTPTFKEEIRKYVKEHNYSFNVLFDNPMLKGKGTGEVFARVSKAYQISGIPLKLIIDKKGAIRFMTSGYKGSASELADEISAMVEKARAQN